MNPEDSYRLRHQMIDIAMRQVGVTEEGRNTGKQVREFQRATNLEGSGWPWCAAFVCWVIREWIKDEEVREALKLANPTAAEKWRPKTAAAYGLEDWAEEHGVLILSPGPRTVVHTADVITFKPMSHVGIVQTDRADTLWTIEGNTGAAGQRDGEGVWSKTRDAHTMPRKFIRILP